MKTKSFAIFAVCLALLPNTLFAAVADGFVSARLKDKIDKKEGEETVDLLQARNGSTTINLTNYLNETNGWLMLGMRLDEKGKGAETSDSLGVAIKSVKVHISGSGGSFESSDMFTSTSAGLLEGDDDDDDVVRKDFFTVFGSDNNKVDGLSGELNNFDDVLWFYVGNDLGEIDEANLEIELADTSDFDDFIPEDFFDFSGGYEELALLSAADAALLENARLGEGDAPAEVTNSLTNTAQNQARVQAALNAANNTSPAAPAPPLLVLAALGGLLVFKRLQ